MPFRIKTVGILSNPGQPSALTLLRSCASFLAERGIRVLSNRGLSLPGNASLKARSMVSVVAGCDLVLSLGGDGTLLNAASAAAPAGKALLGINLGRLGYLTPVAAGEALGALDLALRGGLAMDRRVMLRAEVLRRGRLVRSDLALNDVVVTKGAMGRIVELDAWVDGRHLTSYRADGLLVATPTGSTAYALSVGGPVLQPHLRNFVLAPISPHTLSNRPLVLSDSCRIEVSIPGSRGASILLTADGRQGFALNSGDRVAIRKAKEVTRLLKPKTGDYWDVLRSKLGWMGR
jgi:NAD+ kinase